MRRTRSTNRVQAGEAENNLITDENALPSKPTVEGLPSPKQEPSSHNVSVRSPFTPVQNMVYSLKSRLEQKLGTSFVDGSAGLSRNTSLMNSGGAYSNTNSLTVDDKTSPGLARLRMTPAGRGLREKQKVLLRKHQDAKSNCDHLNVGGGVSIWPGMENMRLTQREVLSLVCVCVVLLVSTILIFRQIHGTLLSKLLLYTDKLSQFPTQHSFVTDQGTEAFTSSVLQWHTSFTHLMEEIHLQFDGSLAKTSITYKTCIVLYILGISTLLFYLLDNILAQSKLTPRRIKIWVSMLVVTGSWTLLIVHLLLQAQRLERAVEFTVHQLNNQLSSLVYQNLNLSVYHDVLLHWRTRCLPPTGLGTLTIMGLLPVQNVASYLQYYSVTVITALLTPVVQLIVSLKDIYSVDM